MRGARDHRDYLHDMLEAAEKVASFDYFGVNAAVVWKTAIQDAPRIAAALRKIVD